MKIMKTVSLILVRVSLLAMFHSAKAENCLDETAPRVPIAVLENEPFVRIWLYRLGATNGVQAVDYFTVDGPGYSTTEHVARAGVHYRNRSGTATFAAGQSATSVDVPLIDNGLLDGFKDFTLALTNAAAGLILGDGRGIVLFDCPDCARSATILIRIEDNELHSTVDPLFVPDVRSIWSAPFAMPDGRVLLSGLTMLQTNGSLDVAFATTFAASFGNASLNPLRVLSDGRIFAAAYYAGDPAPRLVRVLPSGALDTLFTITNFTALAAVQPDGRILALSTNADNQTVIRRFNSDGSPDLAAVFTITNFMGIAAEQPDGKVLVLSHNTNHTTALSRRNADGSPDAGFAPSTFVSDSYEFALQADAKILVRGEFSYGRSELRRLNTNGSPDNSFPLPIFNAFQFRLRRDGKVIVSGDSGVVQLNTDGSVDANFHLDAVSDWNVWRAPEHELSDGRLLTLPLLGFQNTVIQWNEDGTLDNNFRPDIVGGYLYCGWRPGEPLTLVAAGQVYVAGSSVTAVDGFPPSLARLLINPPERDFRVLTPAEFSRSSGLARVRVQRTGPTTNAASVSFSTSDDTAKAGRHSTGNHLLARKFGRS